MCTRLSGKILRTVNDVINDVTNDVIFILKKLILKSFLHIKGGKLEGSRLIHNKEHRLGFSKICRNARFDLRSPSYGARKIADFRQLQTKLGERTTDEP